MYSLLCLENVKLGYGWLYSFLCLIHCLENVNRVMTLKLRFLSFYAIVVDRKVWVTGILGGVCFFYLILNITFFELNAE